MRKLKASLIIVILYLVIYFLQINIFSWVNVKGIKPNLFICLTLIIGLFAGEKLGVIFGLGFGLILDLLIGKTIGPSAICLGFIGLIGEYFDKNFSKDSLIAIIAMVITSTIIYEIVIYSYDIIRYKAEIEINSFIIILLIEIMLNLFMTIIFYPLIKKFGYYIEEIFKGKKVLTRYF